MRDHLATLVEDFRHLSNEIAVVRYQGNRRRTTTYGELAVLAGRFAALLERRGIGLGDRVLLWAENSAEWIAVFHGCLLRGALVVPLDASGSVEFARRVANDVKPKLVVGDGLLLAELSTHPGDNSKDVARVGRPIGSGSPTLSAEKNGKDGVRDRNEDAVFPHLEFETWLGELPGEEAGLVAGLSPETPLQILFTSGTTGDPKGVVITHGNVLASVGPVEQGAQPYMRYEWLVHPLRILHTLPLSHVFGQTMGLWIPPILRAELHFESRPAAPRLIQLIRKERISVLAAVPRVLALLKAHLETSDPALAARVEQATNIGPLKKWWRFRAIHKAFGIKFWAFVSGGGALAGPLEQFWNALGFVLIQGYGMTETTALVTLNHPFHVAKGTIGKPLAGREVKLGPDGEVLVRGPMISNATWQGGELRQSGDEWLATGDLAEQQASGELRFLGRKSEVIVTASGMNLHPEDMEAAVEEQPGVAACAVVAMETATGPEPCAVLAIRGASDQAAKAIESANTHLAEFQRIRRWVLWPEPDLPRTSTGKVRRKAVANWLAQSQAANGNGTSANGRYAKAIAASSDWLLTLIAQITGETLSNAGDELRLSEDLHLDSLGRVQLAAAVEQRLGIVSSSGLLEEVQTLGELRKLVGGEAETSAKEAAPTLSTEGNRQDGAREMRVAAGTAAPQTAARVEQPHRRYLYLEWPWWKPVAWMRVAFLEAIARPLTRLLANPRVVHTGAALPAGPLLIVANHVTAYDAPLVQYALPGRMRQHIAVAMSGEVLEDFRHARDPNRASGAPGFSFFGPAAYFLATTLFNVFPLPRLHDFQISFAHAGKAMDRGYNVLVFPEGARSAEGKLARFRPGIGLLAKQSGAPVLPVAVRGLGELKVQRRGWFRSGKIEVRVGEAIRFRPEDSEAAITARLQDEVQRLLADER
ncbi:MAG TPA: AMP-binding protein [Terracidiphilus sp.]|nr:AMP-binding protein [Terracidiphilus sp.]